MFQKDAILDNLLMNRNQLHNASSYGNMHNYIYDINFTYPRPDSMNVVPN